MRDMIRLVYVIARYYWPNHRTLILESAILVGLMRLGYMFEMPREVVSLLLFPCMLPLMLLFYNDYDAGGAGQKLRLSPHLFRLPVSSFRLFLALSLYNALVGVIWVLAMALALPRVITLANLVDVMLFFVSLLLTVQAMCWSLGRIHALAAIAGIMAVVVGLGVDAVLYGRHLALIVTPLALFLSWISLVTDRQGVGLLRQGYVPSWRAGRRKPFRNARHAQIWFEWRRREFLIPWTVALTGFAILIAFLAAEELDVDALPVLLILSLFMVAFLSMFRYALAVDSTRGSYAAFVYTRPVDDGILARWQGQAALTGAGATAAAIGFWAAFLSIVLLVSCDLGAIPSIFAAVAGTAAGIVVATWMAYASGLFAMPLAWFLLVLSPIARETSLDDGIFFAMAGAWGIGAIVILILAKSARQTSLLVHPLHLMLVWLFVSAVLFAASVSMVSDVTQVTPVFASLLFSACAALAVVAALPAATIPLTLSRRRHREASSSWLRQQFNKVAAWE